MVRERSPSTGGSSDEDDSPQTTVPRKSVGDGVGDEKASGYFDTDHSHQDGASPVSLRSNPLSIRIPPGPSADSLALASLQYLPMPLVVLSSMKTVVLANEAMGRLLDIDFIAMSEESESRSGDVLSATDVLRGLTLGQLGIDMLQNGSPIWVAWDVSMVSMQFHYYCLSYKHSNSLTRSVRKHHGHLKSDLSRPGKRKRNRTVLLLHLHRRAKGRTYTHLTRALTLIIV